MSSINQKPLSLQEEATVFALADKAIGDSLESGSFDFAAEVISSYRSLSRVSELGQSKVLHGVNRYWHNVEHKDGDDYFAWSVRATGYVHATVERHISVWEMLSNNCIPEQYQKQIEAHTVRQLFKIYSLVVAPMKRDSNYDFLDAGYFVEDEDWLALSEASDERRVAEIVAKVKGKERNKNFMSLKIDGRGDIIVYQGGEQESVGFLNIGSQDLLIHKAIRRIMDGAGITMKEE